MSLSRHVGGYGKNALIPSICDKQREISTASGTFEQHKLDLRGKIASCSRLMRCHTLMPVVIIGIPVMWSAALALPPVVTLVELKKIALLALGTFFTRFAGCCINDLADAKIDRQVARTKSRPLAAKEITYKEALITLAINSSIALGILLQFDMNTIRFGCIGATMASVYPFLKRSTNYPQVFLGASLAIGTLMAWTSISLGPITMAPLCIYGAACMWTVIYDTVYAHQDKEFDKMIGVKSLALHWGDDTKKMCKIMAYNMTLLMTACGYIADLSTPFYASTLLSHIWMEKEINRVNLNDPVDCLGFFKRNTIYGGILLAGILAGKESLEFSLDPIFKT
ncbi:4-hydroxybenzoate octaprenyltransferase, putative [Theileria equi strain WA]|uniref:4-hydroxybenzoate polyprenyltransferase, mitochondrial n=1 Tax=Theileria equi strain WA TaxID=1537102 RepID=L1LCR9_THEEQ|nr:4-hydroxybenzoate octaprenyltransferase, putative [Theileria equi strain WA]EKX73136.1 4-hydroxybenzoate octaprenyltransferase, putative [Theileria equi strain WA]|eukprot:XP_004832588.1 4-hydroxybenzoate octaprenyltransferase, putative [Theileria equi strain WA]